MTGVGLLCLEVNDNLPNHQLLTNQLHSLNYVHELTKLIMLKTQLIKKKKKQ